MIKRVTEFGGFLGEKIFGLSRVFGIIAIIVLISMMVFTITDILLRALFDSPILGDVELIKLSMVCAGFLGFAWCASLKMHVKVDLLSARFPKIVNQITTIANYFLAMALGAVFAWRAWEEGLYAKMVGMETQILNIRVFPFYWIMAIGYIVFCLVSIVLFFKSIKNKGVE